MIGNDANAAEGYRKISFLFETPRIMIFFFARSGGAISCERVPQNK